MALVRPDDRRRGALVVCAVALSAFCYFAIFLRYGINVPAEGMLLHGFERMADGERPYEDFFVDSGPGIYYVHSALQGWFAQSIVPGRIALALVNSAAAAALTLLAQPLVGVSAAAVAGLLYVAMMPVYAGAFAVFNVPYPDWYSVLLFLIGLLVARRYLDAPRAWLPPLLGALAALGFLFDPFAGLLQLACAALLLLACQPRLAIADARGSARLVPSIWWAAWFVTVAVLLVILGSGPSTAAFRLFALPAIASAILVARCAGRQELATSPRSTVLAIVGVLLGFIVVAVPWVCTSMGASKVPAILQAHWHQMRHTAHPRVLVTAAVVVAGFLFALRLPRTLERRGLPAARIALVALGLGLAGVVFVLTRRPMIYGFGRAAMQAFETSGAYVLAIAVVWLLILSAWNALGASSSGDVRGGSASSLLVVTAGASLLYARIDPGMGFASWVTSAPLFLAGAVYLAGALAGRWGVRASAATRKALALVVLAPLLVVAGASLANALGAVAQLEGFWPRWRASVALETERAPVWINIGRAEEYRDLTRVVAFLRENTKQNERVATFPALDLVSFLSGRASPYFNGYFAPGWIAPRDEAQTVATLERDPPRFAVVFRDRFTTFESAPLYYFQLADYFEREYRAFVTFGRFVILENRNVEGLNAAPPAISRDTTDDRLTAYLRSRLAVSNDADRRAAVRAIADDRISGNYAELTSLLAARDPGVRNEVVRALVSARDGRTASALAAAATSGALDATETVLALRSLSLWADTTTIPALLEMLDAGDGALVEAAKNGLANAAERRFAESFWPGGSSSPASLQLDDKQRLRVRDWLRDPRADARLKRFAIAAAAGEDYHELWSAVYARCDRSDAEPLVHPTAADGPTPRDRDLNTSWPCVACSPERLLARFANALAVFAGPLPARVRLLYGLTQQAFDPLVARASFDMIAYERQVAPRAALAALRKSKSVDTLVAAQIRAATSADLKERLLWIATLAAGPASVEAAADALTDRDVGVRIAAAWTVTRRADLKDEQLRAKLQALELDADSAVRDAARLALQHVRLDDAPQGGRTR